MGVYEARASGRGDAFCSGGGDAGDTGDRFVAGEAASGGGKGSVSGEWVVAVVAARAGSLGMVEASVEKSDVGVEDAVTSGDAGDGDAGDGDAPAGCCTPVAVAGVLGAAAKCVGSGSGTTGDPLREAGSSSGVSASDTSDGMRERSPRGNSRARSPNGNMRERLPRGSTAPRIGSAGVDAR